MQIRIVCDRHGELMFYIGDEEVSFNELKATIEGKVIANLETDDLIEMTFDVQK